MNTIVSGKELSLFFKRKKKPKMENLSDFMWAYFRPVKDPLDVRRLVTLAQLKRLIASRFKGYVTIPEIRECLKAMGISKDFMHRSSYNVVVHPDFFALPLVEREPVVKLVTIDDYVKHTFKAGNRYYTAEELAYLLNKFYPYKRFTAVGVGRSMANLGFVKNKSTKRYAVNIK